MHSINHPQVAVRIMPTMYFTEFSASCSVTVVDDTANVTLNSNVNGTFQCIVDGRDPETCKESNDTLLAVLSVDSGILAT